MKILNIYFKNINSLEGDGCIHFDRTPISESGIFAITGPNGSGKSSILDVITLALYGETFRFDHPVDHVMTKTKTVSFAQVDFLLEDNIYQSSWHVQREKGKSTGALLNPEMKLFHLNGSKQLIEDVSLNVRNRIVELTGMDFHKFSKSMVLAQGDFSAFLNALDSERMDVLEKISGKSIYQEFEHQAVIKNTLAQTQLQDLEQELNAIPVIDPVSREASEMDFADFQEQYAELKQAYETIHQQLVSAQRIANLKNQVDSLSQQQQLIDTQLKENQRKLDKIDALPVVKNFEDDLQALDSQTEKIQESKKILDGYRNERDRLQKQLNTNGIDVSTQVINKTVSQQKNSIEQIQLRLDDLQGALATENLLTQSMDQHSIEKKTILERIEAWLQAHTVDESLEGVLSEMSRLSDLKQQLTEALEKLQAYSSRLKNTTKELTRTKKKQQELVKKTAGLKTQISKNQPLLKTMSGSYRLEELQEMESFQQTRTEQFQTLKNKANAHAKLSNKSVLRQLFQTKGADREEQELIEKVRQLQLEIGKQQRTVKTLEAAVFNEDLLQKVQDKREYLHEDKACPLCGALEHPYLKYPPAVSNSNPLLIEQKKKLKGLNANASNLTKQIAVAKKQAEKDQQNKHQSQIIYSQWNRLANKLNVAFKDLEINQLNEMKTLLVIEKTELSNLQSLIKKYCKQQLSIEQATAAIELNKNTLKQLGKEAELLDLEISNGPDKSGELETMITTLQQSVQLLETKIVRQLNTLGEKMPLKKGKEKALIQRLKMRKQDYYSSKVQVKTVTEEMQNLAIKITASQLKIEEIKRDIEEHTVLLQQEKLTGLHLSLIEKQKLIADKAILLSRLEKDFSSLKQDLLEQSQDFAKGNLKVVRETVELTKSRGNTVQTRLELTQLLSKIWKNITLTKSKLETEKVAQPTDKTEDELISLDQAMKEKMCIVKQELESLQNQLNKQAIYQEKYDALLLKVGDQQTIAEACEQEIKFITQDNGIHLRHKLQQEMADKLLSESNQVLKKISGRYYLRQGKSEQGFALEIEDSKQKNSRRLVKSLSGGESFIVSLALALGLSEMANNGRGLDSLFLDEGFGNLDAEALYLAMTTLESLKSHGKIVGVISHVEGVRKRIKTQVKMIKKPNGMSGLKVIS